MDAGEEGDGVGGRARLHRGLWNEEGRPGGTVDFIWKSERSNESAPFLIAWLPED